MKSWIDCLRADLRTAEAIYQHRKERADTLRNEAEWADKARVDAGQEVGRLKAAIAKESSDQSGE